MPFAMYFFSEGVIEPIFFLAHEPDTLRTYELGIMAKLLGVHGNLRDGHD